MMKKRSQAVEAKCWAHILPARHAGGAGTCDDNMGNSIRLLREKPVTRASPDLSGERLLKCSQYPRGLNGWNLRETRWPEFVSWTGSMLDVDRDFLVDLCSHRMNRLDGRSPPNRLGTLNHYRYQARGGDIHFICAKARALLRYRSCASSEHTPYCPSTLKASSTFPGASPNES